jgi:hypothetical protein
MFFNLKREHGEASNLQLWNILVVGLWELDQKLGALQVVAQKVRFLQFLAAPKLSYCEPACTSTP